jgi:hypothetical protein
MDGSHDLAAGIPDARRCSHNANLSLQIVAVFSGEAATRTPSASNRGAAAPKSGSSSSIVGTSKPIRSLRQTSMMASR